MKWVEEATGDEWQLASPGPVGLVSIPCDRVTPWVLVCPGQSLNEGEPVFPGTGDSHPLRALVLTHRNSWVWERPRVLKPPAPCHGQTSVCLAW